MLESFKTLYNNTTISIGESTLLGDDDSADLKPIEEISCPKLGEGDVMNNTNSPFCKVSMIVNYNWQKISGLNWLAIHRSQPILGYVINPSYTTSLIKNTIPDPSEQVLRIINYESRMLGMCKGKFSSPVADLCFSYNCPSQKEVLIAAIDRGSNINVFSYSEDLNNTKSKYEVKLLLDVRANSYQVYETVALSWCPYVGSEDEEENETEADPGMKLAIASEKSVEVISIDKLVQCNSEFKRSELDADEHDYSTHYDEMSGAIIKVFLSSDGNAVCSASDDNSIKFFQLESPSKLKQMHSWEPALSNTADKISFFHFLDDYNKLLENYQHEFWGFAFVGTESGEISIWNLRKWNATQRLKINGDDLDSTTGDTGFKYKADITSHFITAFKGETVFIIQIEPVDSFDKAPKIVNITRFTQYNYVLSFICKRSSTGKELDMFWLTPKSLERCTIQTDQLVDENQEKNSKSNPLFNKLTANSDSAALLPQQPVNLSLPNIENGVIKKATPAALDDTHPINSTMQNPMNLLKFFGNSFKTTFTGSPNQSVIPKISSLDQIEKPSTPTSQEVENLFNPSVSDSTGKTQQQQPPLTNNISVKKEIDLNKILPPQLNKSESSNFPSFASKNTAQKGSEENLNTTTLSLPSALDVSTLVGNKDTLDQINRKLSELMRMTGELAKNQETLASEKKLSDCRLEMVEEKLLKEMAKNRLSANEAIAKVNNEVECMRRESKDPSEFKFMSKITESFLRKLMEQLNQTISKGLDEFMAQMKGEMNELQQQVNKIRTQLDTRLDQCCKKNEKYTKQLSTVMDRLKELNDQQQGFAGELTANLSQLRQLPSVSPSPKQLLNNSLGSVSFSSIISKEDEERQLREEKIRNVWALIRTQENAKILDAVSLALDLRDEQVITKVLQHFADKHTHFISIIKNDQTVLISLLHQLTIQSLEKELWKIKFLPDIITSLDMNSPIVKKSLPLFINKLIDKLKAIDKIEGINRSDVSNISLILFVLNQCKNSV